MGRVQLIIECEEKEINNSLRDIIRRVVYNVLPNPITEEYHTSFKNKNGGLVYLTEKVLP